MIRLFRALGSQAPSPHLVGPRLFLRPPRDGDYPAWSALREQSRDYLIPWEPRWADDALSRGHFRRRLERYEADWRAGTGYALFLIRLDDDALLGGVTLSQVRRGVAFSGTLGYWTGAPFAGQGYMTEAVILLARYAFADLGLHRLDAACLPSNTPSRRVLEKAGFSREGYARQYLKINDRWEDHLLFALLEDDPLPALPPAATA